MGTISKRPLSKKAVGKRHSTKYVQKRELSGCGYGRLLWPVKIQIALTADISILIRVLSGTHRFSCLVKQSFMSLFPLDGSLLFLFPASSYTFASYDKPPVAGCFLHSTTGGLFFHGPFNRVQSGPYALHRVFVRQKDR